MGKLLLLLLPFVIISSAENGGAEVQQFIELARKAGDDFAKSGTNDVGILEAGLKDQTMIPPYLTYSWQYREKGLLGSALALFSVEMFSGTKQKSLSGDYSVLALVLSTMIKDSKVKGLSPGVLSKEDLKTRSAAVAAWNVLDNKGKTRKAIIRAIYKKALDEIIFNYDSWSEEV